MFGIGATEFFVIALIALLLFGAPVLTFLMGYALGKKRTASAAPTPPDPSRPAPREESSLDD